MYCSELVPIVAEYRVYCVNGEIRGICHYKGPKDAALDEMVVRDAAYTLFHSDEGKNLCGCSLDFAVVMKDGREETALIEVNDGYSLGWYEGVSGKAYTELLAARWQRLMQ